MGVWGLAKTVSRRLESIAISLTDALPLYRVVRGTLASKETSPDGKCYFHVAHAKVEVDAVTFGMLDVGDMLKVRYTRRDRSINIDRYVPLDGGE